MTLITYAERLTRLRTFDTWLASRAIEGRSQRIRRYIEILERLESAPHGAILPHEQQDEIAFALREIDEILWIHRGLARSEPPGAIEVLRKALKGAPEGRDDSARASARDFQLELRIASYFLQTGFAVDMSSDADLVVELRSGRLFVECKRLESPRNAMKRAKQAARQLRARYRTGRIGRRFGLAVFDVSKILHPGQGLTIGGNATLVRDGLRAQLQHFLDEVPLSGPFESDRRALSVWVQIMTPALNLEEKRWDTRFSSIHIPLVPPLGPRAKAFSELRKALEHS